MFVEHSSNQRKCWQMVRVCFFMINYVSSSLISASIYYSCMAIQSEESFSSTRGNSSKSPSVVLPALV